PAYLRAFPQRLELTPEQMGGTRVLSNPPLVTALAYGIDWLFWNPSHDGAIERWLVESQGLLPEDAAHVAQSLRTSMVFTLIWALSGVAAYLLGRVFLSPAGAAVFAVIVTFNPCTVHFVPG